MFLILINFTRVSQCLSRAEWCVGTLYSQAYLVLVATQTVTALTYTTLLEGSLARFEAQLEAQKAHV